MSKTVIGFLILAALSLVLALQLRTTARLRRDLAEAFAQNARLQDELAAAREESQRHSAAGSTTHPEEANRLQELETEVLRLRGVAGRVARAEAEVAQMRSELGRRPAQGGASPPVTNPGSETLLTYLGDAVAPPPNLDPAYSKEGLLTAIDQAARQAGVTLKKVEIETSEFPFLAGVICEEADFEKLKAQFKQMDGYQYGGGVSSHRCYAFNLVPSSAYPAASGQNISRRTTLREQMFFDQLARQN